MPRGRTPRGGDRGPHSRSFPRERRGVSSVVGVVLLVGLVVAGSAVVTLAGSSALGGARKSVELTRAEQAMTELDARASDTAFGLDGRSTRDVAFGPTGREGHLRTSRDSWLRVRVLNASSDTPERNATINVTLGTVRYDQEGSTVAYEGGGVWRSDGTGSSMVAPPEFHYRNATLTLPLLTVDGDAALTRRFQVRQAGPSVRKFPNESAGLANRVEAAKVAVTVHSDYYEAWGRYFEATSDGVVSYDHTAETTTVTFLSLPRWVGLDTGVIATSGNGETRLQGNSIYIDSYDSSAGTYADTHGANGSITAVGDVVATGDSNVQGDVRSGAVADLSGTTAVSGTVYWTDGYQPGGAAVNGGDERIDGVATVEPIDGYVERAVAAARASNDNANATVISDGKLTGTGTLTAGTYYVENLTVSSGETLTLDTSDGNVTIAVADRVSVVGKGTHASQAARVEVVGDGTATLFVLGDDPVDMEVGKNGRVDVPDERSHQFRVYGTRAFDAEVTSDQSPGQIRFEGVIYAPAGYDGSGSVTVGQAALYGAIVTGDLTIKQGAEIHYDRGLAGQRFPRSPTTSRLEFLHVAVHRVEVTNR